MEYHELSPENLIVFLRNTVIVKDINTSNKSLLTVNLGTFDEFENYNAERPIEDFEPLALDFKWFIRYGFIHDENYRLLYKNDICFTYNSDLTDGFYLFINQEVSESKTIKYVHELQNLCQVLYKVKLGL